MNEFINRINNAQYYRIHIIQNNLNQFIDLNKLNDSIQKYRNYDFCQDNVYCIKLIENLLQENQLLKTKTLPYLIDDFINNEYYNVPVVFKEPVIIKDDMK